MENKTKKSHEAEKDTYLNGKLLQISSMWELQNRWRIWRRGKQTENYEKDAYNFQNDYILCD